ncbi:MAG: hypothetical protein AMXMBFR6_03060 [Betaproteobacteria bacterium]|nr:type II toxin-antitoxin system RelE/ParE family toxin [Rhodocyclaceae bacterium]
MYTVTETQEFQTQARKVWSDDELFAFIAWIAENPLAGDVIPGADGARKVRWSAQGKGKRGGARVIYFNMLDDSLIVLLAVYLKSERENMTAKAVKGAKHGHEKS